MNRRANQRALSSSDVQVSHGTDQALQPLNRRTEVMGWAGPADQRRSPSCGTALSMSSGRGSGRHASSGTAARIATSAQANRARIVRSAWSWTRSIRRTRGGSSAQWEAEWKLLCGTPKPAQTWRHTVTQQAANPATT
jgi:hypothetical protein